MTSDIAVLVVPDGWLISAAGGAVGVAVPGLRAVILEANSPAYTLSHEISHVFGVQHTQGLVPAFGARVDTRVNRAGNDWMAPTTTAQGMDRRQDVGPTRDCDRRPDQRPATARRGRTGRVGARHGLEDGRRKVGRLGWGNGCPPARARRPIRSWVIR